MKGLKGLTCDYCFNEITDKDFVHDKWKDFHPKCYPLFVARELKDRAKQLLKQREEGRRL